MTVVFIYLGDLLLAVTTFRKRVNQQFYRQIEKICSDYSNQAWSDGQQYVRIF